MAKLTLTAALLASALAAPALGAERAAPGDVAAEVAAMRAEIAALRAEVAELKSTREAGAAAPSPAVAQTAA
ncbi:MAG: hypothetical protein QOJ27_1510, partial [Sphingomonadales bacterium]|nr:hypothetical protein [Sphingomonadales bacterium]